MNNPKIIYLGAGSGERLRPYTNDVPKWLLPLRGIPILEYSIASAHQEDITDVIVVRGSKKGSVKCPSVQYVDNLAGHNMVYSLFLAEQYLAGDTIVSYADILYEPTALRNLKNTRAPISVVIDVNWRAYYEERASNPLDIAESLVLEGDRIVSIGQPINCDSSVMGQYIGLMKFTDEGVKILRTLYHELSRTYKGAPWRNARVFEHAYMTDVLQELIERGVPLQAVPIQSGWLEFDTVSDYEKVIDWDSKGTLNRFIDLEQLPKHPSVLSAGGVVLLREHDTCYTLLVGDGAPRQWRLPKGMQEPGESVSDTALREVLEETGITADIQGYIARIAWTYEFDGVLFDERVYFFLMHQMGGSIDNHDAEYAEVRWMAVEEAINELKYDNEREVLAKAVELDGRS